ncbi:MAG: hotdog domain-containing protein [Methylococcaceae bacterium]|jgi:predicted thioesterase
MNSAIKITVGVEAEAITVVTKELTVRHFHSNMPEVYATPCMIHLMEIAAGNAVQPYLPAGWVSVGVDVNIRHLAPTPVDRTVTAYARVTKVTDKLIEFEVLAQEGKNLIGKGTHSRAPVNLARFEQTLSGLST